MSSTQWCGGFGLAPVLFVCVAKQHAAGRRAKVRVHTADVGLGVSCVCPCQGLSMCAAPNALSGFAMESRTGHAGPQPTAWLLLKVYVSTCNSAAAVGVGACGTLGLPPCSCHWRLCPCGVLLYVHVHLRQARTEWLAAQQGLCLCFVATHPLALRTNTEPAALSIASFDVPPCHRRCPRCVVCLWAAPPSRPSVAIAAGLVFCIGHYHTGSGHVGGRRSPARACVTVWRAQKGPRPLGCCMGVTCSAWGPLLRNNHQILCCSQNNGGGCHCMQPLLYDARAPRTLSAGAPAGVCTAQHSGMWCAACCCWYSPLVVCALGVAPRHPGRPALHSMPSWQHHAYMLRPPGAYTLTSWGAACQREDIICRTTAVNRHGQQDSFLCAGCKAGACLLSSASGLLSHACLLSSSNS